MAYIGAVAPGYDPTRASVPQLDAERFSGDATTTAFTLTRQVVSPTDIDVIVENVTQEPTVAYSVNGYTLTFTGAPGSGTNNIYVIYRASAGSNYAYVPDGSITYAKLANNIRQFTVDTFTANGTGSTVALTEAPASANSLIVSVDGVIQTAPSNYTLSGSTITFTGVPDSGANVVVKHIGFRTTSTVTALQASSVTATEIADGAITNAKIVSVANTKITGNIVSSQITSVANTQITGNITSSQIATVANTQITGNITSSQITSDPTFYRNVSVTGTSTLTGNVGIGTSSPSYKVDIRSAGQTAIAVGDSSDSNRGIQLRSGTAADPYSWVDTNTSARQLSFGVDGTKHANITYAGLLQFNSGYGSVATAYGCRAWVNFNGTGTVAIRASGNVSSITDNGTGDYTVNFTTAMVDANYTIAGVASADLAASFGAVAAPYQTAPSTSAIRVNTRITVSLTVGDALYVFVQIFR
jgi:hypothetical protein